MRRISLTIVLLLVASSITSAQAAPPRTNGICTKLGQIQRAAAINYICSKSANGGLRWKTFGARSDATPTSKPSPAKSPTRSSSNSSKTSSPTPSVKPTNASKVPKVFPVFEKYVQLPDGYSVEIYNYLFGYSFNISLNSGSYTVSEEGVVTVSGLGAGDRAILTVSAKESGSEKGWATFAGSALPGAAALPTFTSLKTSSTGFTIKIANFDKLFNWSVTSTLGEAQIDRSGNITVTGLTLGSDVTLTVKTDRLGYSSGVGSLQVLIPLGKALIPNLSSADAACNSIGIKVTNYDASFTWKVTSSTGKSEIDSKGNIIILGLTTSSRISLTITANRTGYLEGKTSADLNTSAGTCIIPVFGVPTSTLNGFIVQVTNYLATSNWTVTASVGKASIDRQGFITVTEVPVGSSSTLTVTTSRAGSTQGRSFITGSPIPGPAFLPTFDPIVANATGFTVQINNYTPTFTWTAVSSSGRVTIDTGGLISVVGMPPASSASVTVTSARAGYETGKVTFVGVSL